MPGTKIELDYLSFSREIGELKEEVATLEAQLTTLEQEHLRSFILFRKLGRYFGFGAAGKLDWARFKVEFKQKELDRFYHVFGSERSVTRSQRRLMAEVKLFSGESLEQALRRFKRQVANEGIIYEAKKRLYYLKPSESKKLKSKLARIRARKAKRLRRITR